MSAVCTVRTDQVPGQRHPPLQFSPSPRPPHLSGPLLSSRIQQVLDVQRQNSQHTKTNTSNILPTLCLRFKNLFAVSPLLSAHSSLCSPPQTRLRHCPPFCRFPHLDCLSNKNPDLKMGDNNPGIHIPWPCSICNDCRDFFEYEVSQSIQ